MKKTLLTAALTLAAVAMMAVPAKRGQWRTVTLSDGSAVRVELRGDEFNHYWQAADGTRYVENDGVWQKASAQTPMGMQHAAARRTTAHIRRLATKRKAQGYTGNKKGLIILVDFPDKPFKTGHDQALFNQIANEKGYSENGFKGSVSDYFSAQSNGLFNLSFDVVGPVRMSKKSTYYGGTSRTGDDEPVDELVKEACRKVDDQVNFANYDWSGNGEVDQVFVLYAGKGQADGGANNTIWPHEYWLSAYPGGSHITLDGKKIDTYACSSELNGQEGLSGIGTICHEFSHCLGLPDWYDVYYSGNFGMCDFSLMDMGSYLGDGMTPPNYTAWERWYSGWKEPIELTADTTVVSGMESLTKNGNTYIIYNEANRNEYYLLENRQQTGWDVNLPSHGLMVSHVDYDPTIWEYNIVNTFTKKGDDYEQLGVSNDHQRMTIFHADNEDGESFYDYDGSYNVDSEVHDLYPYNGLDSLTNRSVPATKVYNANTDGSNFMNRGLYRITENSDGTVSFECRPTSAPSADVPIEGDYLLHETFDNCNGEGGNSGGFGGTLTSGMFSPDLDGWVAYVAIGADRCGRFGNSSTPGFVTSPTFTAVADTMTLSFRAAGWDAKRDGTDLLVVLKGNGTFVDSQSTDMSLTMAKGAWTTYTLRFTATGKLCINFQPSKRFFLDDVAVTVPSATGISAIEGVRPTKTGRVYSLSGKYLGTDLRTLPRGIYIVDGKKVVK